MCHVHKRANTHTSTHTSTHTYTHNQSDTAPACPWPDKPLQYHTAQAVDSGPFESASCCAATRSPRVAGSCRAAPVSSHPQHALVLSAPHARCTPSSMLRVLTYVHAVVPAVCSSAHSLLRSLAVHCSQVLLPPVCPLHVGTERQRVVEHVE